MQGKKIIIAHNWLQTSFNTQSVKLAMALSVHNKVIFLSQQRLPQSPMQVNDNLTVIQWPHKRPTRLADFLFYYKLAKSFKPHYSICHFAAHNVVTIIGALLGIQRIAWYHTLTEQTKIDFKGSRLSFWLQRNRKKVIAIADDVTITPSAYARQDVIRYYRMPPHKVFTIANAIPDHPIRNHNNGQPIFSFLGRYDACKGIDILLQAFALAHRQNPAIQLQLAGGKLSPAMQQLIQQNNLQHAVHNIGYLPYDQVLHYLAGSYAFIIPSRIDNLPTVVIEALSTATPVIAAAAGGIPEMVKDAYNGLLFKTENPQQLAARIIQLAQDPALRNTLAQQARTSYLANYTIDKHVQQVIDCLNGLSHTNS
jgi:glycosyltransferase involved in cell wall biosynthesis